MRAKTILLLLPCLAGLACGDGAGPGDGVASVDLADPGRPVEEGETVPLTVTLTDAQGKPLTGRTVTWTSVHPTIATVDDSGMLLGLKAGSALIRASAGGHQDSMLVTVVPAAIAAIEIAASTDTLPLGISHQAVATVRDTRGAVLTGRTPEWGTTTPGVLSVTVGGQITPILRGHGVLTATSGSVSTNAGVEVLERFEQFSVPDGFFSCALSSAGAAWCWGTGPSGSLGNGSGQNSFAPVPVAGGYTFAQLAKGSEHACGLTAGGAAYCWGRNYEGQLGDGTRVDRPTPVPVAGGFTFALLTASNTATCGIEQSTTMVYCWGSQVGGSGNGLDTALATPASSATGFTTLTLTNGSACGLVSGGAAYCWGTNWGGRLGVGDTLDRSEPTPVVGGHSFVSLVAGWGHVCGVALPAEIYCWGWNFVGQLGQPPSIRYSASPLLVTTPEPLLSLSASGGGHTCGIAASGTGYCWGSNARGELAQTTSSYYWDPVPIAGLSFSALSAGNSATCGNATDGYSYCWGDNLSGGLGNGRQGEYVYHPGKLVFR